MNELDPQSIVPLYKQLKDLLLQEIKEGIYKANQKIPTELELSEKYQISRMTVRKALAELVEEGVLAKKQGKGTFVQEEKMTEDLSSPNSFTNLCKRNGKVPGGKTLKCTLQEAKDRDRQQLKLENGEMVILVERVRTADDVPVMLEKLYFPGHLKNILVEDLNNASLSQILLEKYGLQSGNSVMEISVCEATPEEAAELKVKTGTPCLLMEEIVYDQYDKPFHRTKSVLRGDKFKYISPRMNVVKHVNSN